jgi:hypothetical protein
MIRCSFQYIKLRHPPPHHHHRHHHHSSRLSSLSKVCDRGLRVSPLLIAYRRGFCSKSSINPQILEKAKVYNPTDQSWTSRWIAPEDVRILSYLSSYLWPSKEVPNSLDIKRRVVISLSLLLSSKLINVYVPFLFKDLIDSLSIVSSNADLVTVTPIALILGYGISRTTSAGHLVA